MLCRIRRFDKCHYSWCEYLVQLLHMSEWPVINCLHGHSGPYLLTPLLCVRSPLACCITTITISVVLNWSVLSPVRPHSPWSCASCGWRVHHAVRYVCSVLQGQGHPEYLNIVHCKIGWRYMWVFQYNITLTLNTNRLEWAENIDQCTGKWYKRGINLSCRLMHALYSTLAYFI